MTSLDTRPRSETVSPCACAQATMNNLLFGNARYQYYETVCGGVGAEPGFDGWGPVQTHMTNTRMTDPEIMELRDDFAREGVTRFVLEGEASAGAVVLADDDLVRCGHDRVGALLGPAQDLVLVVQHVLGVVQLARDGVLDVVDQFEDIPAGHHAACRHRHAAGFFDDRTQFIESFKNSVHGDTLQA